MKLLAFIFLFSASLLKAQCTISFQELEHLVTLDSVELDSFLVKKEYVLLEKFTYAGVYEKGYACGLMKQTQFHTNFTIRKDSTLQTYLEYTTHDLSYFLKFREELMKANYHLIEKIENQFTDAPATIDYYSNGKFTIQIYEFCFNKFTSFNQVIYRNAN